MLTKCSQISENAPLQRFCGFLPLRFIHVRVHVRGDLNVRVAELRLRKLHIPGFFVNQGGRSVAEHVEAAAQTENGTFGIYEFEETTPSTPMGGLRLKRRQPRFR